MQTPETAHLERLSQYKQEIKQIEYDYHYTRKVKQATIELAESYIRRGFAEAVVLPKLEIRAQPDKIVDTPCFTRIQMEPHITGRAVQDVLNVWHEAESVAYRAISEPK